ncbi:P-type ATPase, partial [Kipferlia bialata]
ALNAGSSGTLTTTTSTLTLTSVSGAVHLKERVAYAVVRVEGEGEGERERAAMLFACTLILSTGFSVMGVEGGVSPLADTLIVEGGIDTHGIQAWTLSARLAEGRTLTLVPSTPLSTEGEEEGEGETVADPEWDYPSACDSETHLRDALRSLSLTPETSADMVSQIVAIGGQSVCVTQIGDIGHMNCNGCRQRVLNSILTPPESVSLSLPALMATVHREQMRAVVVVASKTRGAAREAEVLGEVTTILAEAHNGRYALPSPSDSGADACPVVLSPNIQGYEGAGERAVLETVKVTLKISGMTCGACVGAVEKAILSCPLVSECAVNLPFSTAAVTLRTTESHSATDIVDTVVDIVTQCGYGASPLTPSGSMSLDGMDTGEGRRWALKCIVSLCIAGVVMTIQMAGPKYWPDSWLFYSILPGLTWAIAIQLVLACAVQFGPGWSLLKKGYKGLIHGSPTMETLFSSGSFTALAFSLLSTGVSVGTAGSVSPPVFYDTVPMLIGFISMGKALENLTKLKAGSALASLASTMPETALALPMPALALPPASVDTSLTPVEVPTSVLTPGSIVMVKAGGRVPVDGVVVSGLGSIDESALTGESVYASKAPAQGLNKVLGGSVLMEGCLYVYAERVGADTQVVGIIDTVKSMQMYKSRAQKTADRVAALFTPILLITALVVFVAWCIAVFGFMSEEAVLAIIPTADGTFPTSSLGAFFLRLAVCVRFTVSLLVAACPCALGLAVPIVLLVLPGVAARYGTLFRTGARAAEAAMRVRAVVFDKTGTLTVGRPSVVAVAVVREEGEEDGGEDAILDLLEIAAVLERQSEHSLGASIVSASDDVIGAPADVAPSFTLRDGEFETVPGRGVKGVLVREGETAAHSVTVGGVSLFEAHGTTPTERERQMSVVRLTAEGGAPEDETLALAEGAPLSLSLSTARGGMATLQDTLRCTVMAVSVDDSLKGYICVSDTVRAEAHAVVSTLSSPPSKAQKNKDVFSCYIVTGDNREAALAIAEQVGIPAHRVASQCLPSDKTAIVSFIEARGRLPDASELERERERQEREKEEKRVAEMEVANPAETEEGEREVDDDKAEWEREKQRDAARLAAGGTPVLFIGDGINDAPCLAMSSMGVAVGSGTDLACQSADAVLMGKTHPLEGVPVVLDLSRELKTRVNGNFIWAAVYNAILLPVASGLLYPLGVPIISPVFASLAMSMSSVSVVLASLTLNWYKYGGYVRKTRSQARLDRERERERGREPKEASENTPLMQSETLA